MSDKSWERKALENVALAVVKEERSRRRWGIFFKLALLIYFVILLILGIQSYQSSNNGYNEPHAAIVDIKGEISSTKDARAKFIITALHKAFKDKSVKGIILNINSPGGSPVESSNIFDEILYLKKKYPKKPVYAICGDICASGSYYIAAAADKIYANKMSMVGSIGVLYNGFGFVNTMKKLGVTRRLQTAGKNKGSLDPFSPEKPGEKARLQKILDAAHQSFIKDVKKGRGKRLAKNKEIFSGEVFIGDQAKKLGLIDDYGSMQTVMRDILKTKKAANYTRKEDFFDRLSNRMGASFISGLIGATESTGLEAKYTQ